MATPEFKLTASEEIRMSRLAEQIEDKAAVMAGLLDSDKDFSTSIVSELDIQTAAKLTPMTMLFHIVAAVDTDAAGTDMDMSDFPVPGSTIKELNPASNRICDRWEVSKIKDGGKRKTIKGSFYDSLFDMLQAGQHIKKQKEIFAKAKQDVASAPAHIRKEYPSKVAIEGQLIYWTQRQANGRKAIRDAMRCYFQREMIHEQFPKIAQVKFQAQEDDKGNPVPLSKRTQPIRLINIAQPDKMEFYDFNVSKFLALRPKETIEAIPNATFDDLIASGAQTRDGYEDDGKIKNTTELLDTLLTLNNILDEKGGDLRVALEKELKGKNKKEFVIALIDLYTELQGFYDQHKAAYVNYTLAENAAKQAAEEKAQKEAAAHATSTDEDDDQEDAA